MTKARTSKRRALRCFVFLGDGQYFAVVGFAMPEPRAGVGVSQAKEADPTSQRRPGQSGGPFSSIIFVRIFGDVNHTLRCWNGLFIINRGKLASAQSN